ncbi:MAG: antibiotic biosynthesis monooxygenase [Xanthobacteraceae bacterium]
MLITVFRSRLKDGVRDEYAAAVDRMNELARTMPGYISHKTFYAEDGERCTIVEFENEAGLRTWRTNAEHIAAQKMARQKYYTAYSVQVCTLDRESKFDAEDKAAAKA